MSKRPENAIAADENEPDSKGPNLILIYAFLLMALLGAMAFAAMVVWPFYVRR